MSHLHANLLGYSEVSGHGTSFVQVHATIPDDAWEYHIRKSLNDAAYKGLDYVPYNTTMPLTPQSDNVKFIWVSSGPTLQHGTPDHEAHASLLSHDPYRVDESC